MLCCVRATSPSSLSAESQFVNDGDAMTKLCSYLTHPLCCGGGGQRVPYVTHHELLYGESIPWYIPVIIRSHWPCTVWSKDERKYLTEALMLLRPYHTVSYRIVLCSLPVLLD